MESTRRYIDDDNYNIYELPAREAPIPDDERADLSDFTAQAIEHAFELNDHTETIGNIKPIAIAATIAPNPIFQSLMPVAFDNLRVEYDVNRIGDISQLIGAKLLFSHSKSRIKSELTLYGDEHTNLDLKNNPENLSDSLVTTYENGGVEIISLDWDARQELLKGAVALAVPQHSLLHPDDKTHGQLQAMTEIAPVTFRTRKATYAIEPSAGIQYGGGGVGISLTDTKICKWDSPDIRTYHQATVTTRQPFFDTNSNANTELTLTNSGGEISTRFGIAYMYADNPTRDYTAMMDATIDDYTQDNHFYPSRFTENVVNGLNRLLEPGDSVRIKRLLD